MARKNMPDYGDAAPPIDGLLAVALKHASTGTESREPKGPLASPNHSGARVAHN